MCDACRAEYENPLDRRFHAQPTACPHCGPQLALWDRSGKVLAVRDEALLAAADALRQGQIVALKGLGGFQLLVDARNDRCCQPPASAQKSLRKALRRYVPDADEADRSACEISDAERDAAAIGRRADRPAALIPEATDRAAGRAGKSVPRRRCCPTRRFITCCWMNSASPSSPPAATSPANRSCIDERRGAGASSASIADLFLTHDRPIARHVDDSVAFVVEDQSASSCGARAAMRRCRSAAKRG